MQLRRTKKKRLSRFFLYFTYRLMTQREKERKKRFHLYAINLFAFFSSSSLILSVAFRVFFFENYLFALCVPIRNASICVVVCGNILYIDLIINDHLFDIPYLTALV